jgi:hypothetical protein
MPVSLRTHADIANALKTLGVSLDDAKAPRTRGSPAS